RGFILRATRNRGSREPLALFAPHRVRCGMLRLSARVSTLEQLKQFLPGALVAASDAFLPCLSALDVVAGMAQRREAKSFCRIPHVTLLRSRKRRLRSFFG